MKIAVRALWSTKSIHRLLWLITYCKATLTIWGSATDQLSSNDSLLLFRKYFKKSSAFYDLPEIQHNFFHTYAHEPNEIDKLLTKSSDPLVKYYLKNTAHISDFWSALNGNIMLTSQSAIVLNKGGSFLSKKQYKAKDNVKIYEIHGKFEVFEVIKRFGETRPKDGADLIGSINTPNTNNTGLNEINDNNIAVNSINIDNQIIGCIRISLRSSSSLEIAESLQTILESHSPGSINVFIFTNGLVKIYIGNKLEQEANFPASNNFE